MKALFAAITGSPFFIYAKIALLAAAIGGAAYFAWDYRSRIAESEKQRAVDAAVTAAVKEINQKLETERKLRAVYQLMAEDQLAKLLKSISNIRIEHKTIENNIYREVRSNPEFYNQPLPPQGYEEWKRSRALPYALPPSSQPPSSSPAASEPSDSPK